MFPEAVYDDDTGYGINIGSEPGVIQTKVISLAVQELLGHGVVFEFELPQEISFHE